MKINRLETHDRLLEFGKQSSLISYGCQQCIDNRPKEFKNYPFYIFAHKRELQLDERIAMYNEDLRRSILNPIWQREYQSMEQVPSARLIWMPRLTKPKAQENSMCFKAYPPGDNIRVIWMLPDIRLWDQYKKGTLLEHQLVRQSIHDFEHDKGKLEDQESDDLPLEKVKQILQAIGKNKTPKLKTSEAFLPLL